MPRKATPLTDTEIRKAKPPKLLVDGDGLAIRVKENSHGVTKTWVFNYYRPFTKKRTNIGLGNYPTVTLERARQIRAEYRSKLAENIDPKDYRRELELEGRRAALSTFEAVYSEWIEVRGEEWSEGYRDRVTKAMKLHILPGLGGIPVKQITREQGKKLLQPIADRKSLETVTKLCRWCNEVLDYAVDCHLISENPFKTLRKSFKKTRSSNRPWIRSEELPNFLKILEKGAKSIEVRNLILWQLHTMVRPAEAAGTRWDEIDFDNKLWTIPPERMKGRKNPNSPDSKRVPHTVPLSEQALAILEEMRSISGHREHVFPSRNHPRKAMNSSTANVAIKRMLENKQMKLVAHGLRSTASTACNEAQFAPHVVEAALAHLDVSSIKGTYDHATHLEQRKTMMQWWSNFIEEAATGKHPERSKQHLKIA